MAGRPEEDEKKIGRKGTWVIGRKLPPKKPPNNGGERKGS